MINGSEWLKKRIASLEEMLAGDELAPDQRAAAEAELATLREDQRHSRRRGWLRIFGHPRP